MFFVPHFGHAKVYETSIWTPCIQISAKTLLLASNNSKALEYISNLITQILSEGEANDLITLSCSRVASELL